MSEFIMRTLSCIVLLVVLWAFYATWQDIKREGEE